MLSLENQLAYAKKLELNWNHTIMWFMREIEIGIIANISCRVVVRVSPLIRVSGTSPMYGDYLVGSTTLEWALQCAVQI